TSVWRRPVMNNDDPRKFHPTQKPVELYEKIIKTYSNEGDTVLDNCSGAGTAAIACINTNRNYICFEWNKDNPNQYYGCSLEWIMEHEQQVFQTI
ncbi:site-specific DNA-methyltransferase, partial [Bacillus spizizenii]|uniref:site-specific DNA-methyltransferase n=1 Tax=Bacillus spizizenii TaxID=96241 RepID=UPI002E1EE007|nr:site-specific DNA-methyltransferase [Bacillus spizizenii]